MLRTEPEALLPNTAAAADEKHLPVIYIENGVIRVNGGKVNRPATEEHFFKWLYLENKNDGN